MGWLTWREATEQALYGAGGFFRRESPAAHFRTAAHAAPDLLAAAFLRLAASFGAHLIVDVGAGGGELLTALARATALPAAAARSVELLGVELADRPATVPESVRWQPGLPERMERALVIANEWLDNVPVDVAEVDAQGVARIVEVDPTTGEERLGGPVRDGDALWLKRWWPLGDAEQGTRAEIGQPRDTAWAGVVSRLESGLAIAIDYAHRREDRPPGGTLTGYRDGRLVRPVPDGSCDVTSHVALDACGAAGLVAGATDAVLTVQRDALRRLGVNGTLPSRDLAIRDPASYLAALSQAARAAELLAWDGLGGFGWLVQAKGVPIPAILRDR